MDCPLFIIGGMSMLRLVVTGPEMIRVQSDSLGKLEEMLRTELQGMILDEWLIPEGIEYSRWQSAVLLVESNEQEKMKLMVFTKPLGVVISSLREYTGTLSLQVLPKIVLFNSVSNVNAVLSKIKAEYNCEEYSFAELLRNCQDYNGAMVVFLEKKVDGQNAFYKNCLFINNDAYEHIVDQLKIHAPRYLAKAFAPNVWHMVDLRVYDRYEAYDVQYRRLLKAIGALSLGHIVAEIWKREITAYAEPIGTYQIRLLTFLEPLELKKRLIGLEYAQDGRRIVDLDLMWHGKRISWKDVLDDKETRRKLTEDEKAIIKPGLFNTQRDKELLVKYCLERKEALLSPADQKVLMQLEQQIVEKSQ